MLLGVLGNPKRVGKLGGLKVGADSGPMKIERGLPLGEASKVVEGELDFKLGTDIG